MELIFDLLSNTKDTLNFLLSEYGNWFYFILFLIIFVETGVVIMPFLPGDSLLFAAGFMAASAQNTLDVTIIILLLIVAAFLGDTCNYFIGKYFGEQALRVKIFGYNFVQQKHIDKTHEFYDKYGAKTIVIARFVPIVRTLAPFVAGVGKMKYSTFLSYNIIGALIWVIGVTMLGYLLGGVEIIEKNFEKVILLIVAVSVLPIIWELGKAYLKGRKENQQ